MEITQEQQLAEEDHSQQAVPGEEHHSFVAEAVCTLAAAEEDIRLEPGAGQVGIGSSLAEAADIGLEVVQP